MFSFRSLKFSEKYKSFSDLLKDVFRLEKYYSEHGLKVKCNIYPKSLKVLYEVYQER